MKPIELKGISWSLILIGILYFTEFYFDFGIQVSVWSGIVLIALSLWLVFNGFQFERRNILIWGTINFFIGIGLFTFSYFEIVSLSQYILPLFIFICFAVFLMLFIENINAKAFLILSVASILIFVAYVLAKDMLFINRISQYISMLLSYKTILLIVIGIFLMLVGKDN